MLYKLSTSRRQWSIAAPQVMGILNCTPDSFYATSRSQYEHEISLRVQRMVDEGASMIDVGGVSTRPGACIASEQEEMRRLRTALTAVRQVLPDTILSVDTFRPDVARMAVEEFGADIINDVSEGGAAYQAEQGAGIDEASCCAHGMMAEVARLGAAYVLMSIQPTLTKTLSVFQQKVRLLQAHGVGSIILDPGYGFGKDIRQNYALMSSQQAIADLFPDMPLLVGVSRKRMVWQLLGCSPEDALNGTTALHMAALANGAAILRVHDVRQAAETIRIFQQLNNV